MGWVVHEANGKIVNLVEGAVDDTYAARVADLGYIASQAPLVDFMEKPSGSVYWNGTAVADRPAMPIVQTGGSLTGLPNPAAVSVASGSGTQTATVTDGHLELTSDVADVYTVRIAAWPYLDWTGTVTIT